MPTFEVDEELAARIEQLAKCKPFENLSFNAALWRVVGRMPPVRDSASGDVGSGKHLKKAPTPHVADWIGSVPELKNRRGLGTWQAVCDHLGIETAGDSARRKLKNWVKQNRPQWPAVPDV